MLAIVASAAKRRKLRKPQLIFEKGKGATDNELLKLFKPFVLTQNNELRNILSRATRGFGTSSTGVSSNGRTADSGSVSEGSTPSTPAKGAFVYGPFV
jgi:hypothetical protein